MIKVTHKIKKKVITTHLKEVKELPKDLSESINEEEKILMSHLSHDTGVDYRGWDRTYLIQDKENWTIGFILLSFSKMYSNGVSITGIYLKPEHRKTGHTSNVAFGIANYLFEYESQEIINSDVFECNLPSLNLQKRYLNLDGRRRKALYYKNAWFDRLLFSITKEEFANFNTKILEQFTFEIK